MKAKVGIVMIGQSSRVDVVPEMKGILGPRVQVMEAGALNDLSLEEAKKMAPVADDYILVLPRMQNCIDDLIKKEAELRIMSCFADFLSQKGGEGFQG